MSDFDPIPEDPWVDQKRGWRVTNAAYDWLLKFTTVISQTARRIATISLDTQSASIGATAMLAGNPGGRFRVNVYVRVEQAATVSSSIVVSIGFTENGVSTSLSTTAIANGVPTSAESRVMSFDHDAAAAITYATTYATVGATPMKYRLRIVVEKF